MSMMAASILLCSHLQAQSKVANEMMDFEPILHEDAEVALGACSLSSRLYECAYTGAEMRKAPADTSDSVQKATHAGVCDRCIGRCYDSHDHEVERERRFQSLQETPGTRKSCKQFLTGGASYCCLRPLSAFRRSC